MTNWEPDQPYPEGDMTNHREMFAIYFFDEARKAAQKNISIPTFNTSRLEYLKTHSPSNQNPPPFLGLEIKLTDTKGCLWKWQYVREHEEDSFRLSQIFTSKNKRKIILYKNDGRGDLTSAVDCFQPSQALIQYAVNDIRAEDAFASLEIPFLNKAIERDQPKLIRKNIKRRRIENAAHFILDSTLVLGASALLILGACSLHPSIKEYTQKHAGRLTLAFSAICTVGVATRRLVQQLEPLSYRQGKWITEFYLDHNKARKREIGEPIPTYKKVKTAKSRFPDRVLTQVDFTYVPEAQLSMYPAAYRAFGKQK